MSLTSILRKEAAKLGLTIREKIGNGAMSEGVFLADRLNTEEKVALKVTEMGTLDLNTDIFPTRKLVPVYLEYQDEEALPNNKCYPAQISIINEDLSDKNRSGSYQVHVFDPISPEDSDLEYRIRQSVAGRECIRILEEIEKEHGTNLVVRYINDQFFACDGFLYHALQMEHLEQLGLDQLIPDATEPDRKLSPQTVYNIAAQLCQLLQLTEKSRIVHLDLKPGNIVVNPYDITIKALDFDLAVLLDSTYHPNNPDDVGQLIRKSSLREDRLAGTPLFTAPEVVERYCRRLRQEELPEITTKPDIFSVGRIIAEMAGAPIGERANNLKWIYAFPQFTNQYRDETVQRILNCGYDYGVASSVAEMLEVDPQRRSYQRGLEVFSERAIPGYSLLTDAFTRLNQNQPQLEAPRSYEQAAFADTVAVEEAHKENLLATIVEKS